MLRDVITRFRAAHLWARAWQLSDKGQHEKVLWVLRSADDEIRKWPSWQLKEIHELGLLERHVGTLESAEALISELLSKPRLTPNEKYFLAFAQWYGRVAFRALHSSNPVPANLESDLSSFSLADVASRWKRAFPMPIHPEWDETKRASEQGIYRSEEEQV